MIHEMPDGSYECAVRLSLLSSDFHFILSILALLFLLLLSYFLLLTPIGAAAKLLEYRVELSSYAIVLG